MKIHKRLAGENTVPGGLDSTEVRDVLRKVSHPLRVDDLLRFLDLSRRQKKALESLLLEMEANGTVMRLQGGKWIDAGQAGLVQGVLSVQRTGVGFVTPDGALAKKGVPGEQGFVSADIYIAEHLLGDAWHGDRVEVVITPKAVPKGQGKRRGAGQNAASQNAHSQNNPPARRPEGRVLRVLERGLKELTVRVNRTTKNTAYCRPADARLSFVLDVDVSTLATMPKEGELLVVTPGGKQDEGHWAAKALRSLGLEDGVDVQEQLVRINHHIPLDFPPRVLAEAALLQAQAEGGGTLESGVEAEAAATPRVSTKERQDLRHLPFVTIDGADARDFDDAICVQQAADGSRVLWVAIADVTHFVRPGSALDAEARDRGNSYYFPASVTPMLPEVLSNGLCSLRPHEDRLTMVACLTCDGTGVVRHSAFFPACIRSQARLTYDQVHEALTLQEPQARVALAPVLPMLEQAQALALLLEARRTARGSLNFEMPEAYFVVDKEHRVKDVCRRERLFAHQLIEECMLAANEAVARFLTEKGLAFPYRVHPEPDPERLERLFRMLGATHLAATLPVKPTAGAMVEVLRQAKGLDHEFLVGRLVLRAMMQARYAPELGAHFGLASACYCHFTSPIRRYADVLVHRALKWCLGDTGSPVLAGQKLLAVCDQCNARERSAQEAEREIARRLGCLVLRDRAGETFTGIIAGVSDFGFFVEFDAMPVEGMVRLTSFPHDWFAFDPDRQELIGEGTGLRFRLGQHVTVRLTDVNVGRLEVNLEWVSTEGEDPTALGRGHKIPGQPRKGQGVPFRSASKQGGTPKGGYNPNAHNHGEVFRGSGKQGGGNQSGQKRGGRKRG